jgi:hypothetical protein
MDLRTCNPATRRAGGGFGRGNTLPTATNDPGAKPNVAGISSSPTTNPECPKKFRTLCDDWTWPVFERCS